MPSTPFRGPVEGIDPNAVGHPYLVPPPDVSLTIGRDLFDGASAVLAFAPPWLKESLERTLRRLKELQVPALLAHNAIRDWARSRFSEWAGDKWSGSPECFAWSEWSAVWLLIRSHDLLPELVKGTLQAFGDRDRLGSQPYWITPDTWRLLKPDENELQKFVGGGETFWNVRVAPEAELRGQIDAAARALQPLAATDGRQAVSRPQPAGGAPEHAAFGPFIREMIRLADMDNLPPDRGGLGRHMREWLAANFPDGGPSDATVRRWLAQFDYRRPEHQ